MKKFSVLVYKELREVLNLQLILPLIVVVVLFMVMGTFLEDIVKASQNKVADVAIMDNDDTELTNSLINSLRDTGYNLYVVTKKSDTDTALSEIKKEGFSALITIPEGFTDGIVNKKTTQHVDVLTSMESFSFAGSMSSSKASEAVAIINEIISTSVLTQNVSDLSPSFVKYPVVSKDIVDVAGKRAEVSPNALMGLVMSQTMLIPIIMFIIIMMSSQTIATAIVNEKSDKTLETLLSTPVPRSVVLTAKMLSSGLVSLLFAGVYLFGMSYYMKGFTGGADAQQGDIVVEAAQALGVTLNTGDLIIIGLQLFLSILIALSVSIILGSLTNDIKSVQNVITPLMITLLFPYMLSMFVDINTLPILPKLLLYLIPFTHTFTTPSNLYLDNYVIAFSGLAYQIVFLAVSISLATALFNSDKIFTLNISFGKKRSVAK